jgi:flagellum-specific peptidoglycan hydrolase FlgJ
MEWLDNLTSGIGDFFSQLANPPQQTEQTGGGLLGDDIDMSALMSLMMVNNINPDNNLGQFYALGLLGGDDNKASTEPQKFQGTNPSYRLPTFKSSETVYNPIAPENLPADKQQMLAQLKQNAQIAFPGNPVMQQVAITQAIHESGLMGTPSKLARQNNLFGIKAPGNAGIVNMPTGEVINGQSTTVNANFGRNKSPVDSFMQYRDLMAKNRYKPVIAANNPFDAFNALQRAGYATDPKYAQKLNRVYSQYVDPLY